MLKFILMLGSFFSLPAMAESTMPLALPAPAAQASPPPAPAAAPGGAPAALTRPDPFKRNPPPEVAAADGATNMPIGPDGPGGVVGLPLAGPGAALPAIPEPPKVPTLGQSSDGRLFLGIVGNRAIYKSGETYVYEKLTTE